MSRKDPAWNYATEINVPEGDGKKGYKYFKCNFCSKEIKGGVKRVKEHLACTRKNVAACPKVPLEIKTEIKLYMQAFEKTKHIAQRNFQEIVDSGSQYGGSGPSGGDGTSTPSEIVNSCPNEFRGVRGPMDRFVNNAGNEISQVNVKEHRNQVSSEIGRFFFENGIPFNCARSASYFSMLRAVGNYGRGLKAPTMHEISNWILKKEVKSTEEIVNEIKATWSQTGVSILSDGWSDMRNRSLINFLVNNQHGTVYLRTVDASDCVKDANKLFELLDGVVEEVGEDFVIQVVTDNASAYKAAGRLLMAKRSGLYWTPCAAHCIDLMLEKIGELPQHKNALLKAKRVTNFIYNHQWVLSLARKYAKKDLVRAAATRFATAFLTLESILELKQPLQMMFVSIEWAGCAWAKKAEGKAVKDIIMDEQVFWRAVVYAIQTTKPLVKVLRLVDGETPAMGFIYGAMDEAKEKIAENLGRELGSYKQIWDIIDQKWESQMHRDLHACAYYLNPRFRWSANVSVHPEIKLGLYNCMDKLLKVETFSKVDYQLDIYTHKRGLFGHRASLSTYNTRSPVDWWSHFGDEVPELKSFAMRVLGLTCSASECERNWSVFNQVHTKRRNRLSTSKLNSLVYVMYNKKLKHNYLKKQSISTDVDPLIVGDVPSDDEWIANPNDEDEDLIELEEEEGGSSSLLTQKRKRNECANEDTESETDED